MNYFKKLVLILLTLTISSVSNAVEIRMAKANWDTGYFQAEIYKQALENIKSILEHYDLTMDNIVKCTCMIDDISEWGQMNEVYKTYFTKNKPSRSAFGADGLALGAKLELECWAVEN